MIGVAGNGHIAILRYLRTLGFSLDIIGTCASAAENGHLEVLKWTRANACPWDQGTCTFAAQGDHLKALLWAMANACPWNK